MAASSGSPRPDKGKGRAAETSANRISHGRALIDSDDEGPSTTASAPTERTRLLPDVTDSPASSRSQRISARLRASPANSIRAIKKRHIRWGRLILVLIIVILALVVVALGVVYVILSSRLDDAQEMAQRGVRLQGPDDVKFVGISDDGREMRFKVDMRAGIDSRAALDDETLPKWMVKWATRHIGAINVKLDGDVEISSRHQQFVKVPGDSVPEISLPLNYGSLDPLYWLANLSLPVTVRLVAAPTELLDYANASYHAGRARANVKVTSATAAIKLLGIPLQFGAEDLTRALQVDIPRMDVGEPRDLVQLGKYSVYAENTTMHVAATATGLNPLANGTVLEQAGVPQHITDIIGRTRIDLPWPLRFSAALPPIVDQTGPLRIAMVDVQPVHLASALQPLVRVKLNGTAVPPPSDDDVPGTDTQLSEFVGNYLDGRKTRVQVSYHPTDAVPSFVAEMLASIPPVELEIPGKGNDEPILDNVTIAHMRIGTTPEGDDMAASGVVRGRLNLPPQFANLSSVLRITRVFDGPPDRSSRRIKHWPPPDVPARVFGRLSPADWLPAHTVVEDGQTWVVANMTDVAMKIVPGRGPQFRSYILLGGRDVETGIWGVSEVKVGVDGFTRKDLELDNVPVSGSFFVSPGTIGRGLLNFISCVTL